MPEYRKGAHSVYDIQYHFVWVTKYRYHVLNGEVALRARELIRQSCMSRDIKILQGHISVDHVHILVSSPPSLSRSKIMQYVKGRTSQMLQDEFSHLKKRYWGQQLWARGYYCATVGTVTEDQIRAYIERHEQEPFPDNFQIDE